MALTELIAPIAQAAIAGIGMVLTTLIGIYVPRMIAAFEARTGVAITDQQRAAVMSAVTTGAGLIQTRLDQGLIRIADIRPDNGTVIQEAVAAVQRVPESAAAQGATAQTVAKMIAARVDTASRGTF